MTEPRDAVVRARELLATLRKLPWSVWVEEHEDSHTGLICVAGLERMIHDSEWADSAEWNKDLAHADFIASAPALLTELADEVERLRTGNDQLRQTVTLCGNCGYRYFSPRQDDEHGLGICRGSR